MNLAYVFTVVFLPKLLYFSELCKWIIDVLSPFSIYLLLKINFFFPRQSSFNTAEL